MRPDDLLSGRSWRILCGDSTKALADLDSESIDCGILDPPAGIAFMGKEWDGDKGGREKWIAWITPIFAELFRLLKPGGHAFVWALPRTSHWTATALEDAGFEIRDKIGAAFGSGFPKSLDLEKTIAAALARGGLPTPEDPSRFAGWGTALKPAIEDWIMVRKPFRGTVAANALKHGTGGIHVDAARVGTSKRVPGSTSTAPEGMGGWGFRRQTGDESGHDPNVGRWPANLVLSHASWIESACAACGVVVPFAAKFCAACGAPVECRRGGCVEHGEKRIRGAARTGPNGGTSTIGYGGSVGMEPGRALAGNYTDPDGTETVSAWSCLATCPDCERSILAPSGGEPPFCLCMKRMRWACPVALIDAQSGDLSTHPGTIAPTMAGMGYGGGAGRSATIEASTGGASRFFNTFAPEPLDPWEPLLYVPKPSTAEREAGCERLPKKSAAELTDREDGSAGTKSPRAGAGRTSSGRGNHHPTVKPRDLLRHFYRLGCPRNGIALDLFGGSGTTATIAAANEDGEGWRCIAVELDPEHVRIAEARCTWWEREGRGSLFAPQPVTVTTPEPVSGKGPAQLDMFGGQR